MTNCSGLYFRARGYACSAKAHDVVRLLHWVGQNATNCGLAALSPEARNVSPSTMLQRAGHLATCSQTLTDHLR